MARDIREELVEEQLKLPETNIREETLSSKEEELSTDEKVESMMNVLVNILSQANMILDDILTEGGIVDKEILEFFTSSKGQLTTLLKSLKLFQLHPEEFLETLKPEERQSVPVRPTMTAEELAAMGGKTPTPTEAQIEQWRRMGR